METAAQRRARILSALEDLVDQEAAAMGNGDINAVLALQERTAPLIDFLAAECQASAGDFVLRERLISLHVRRERTSSILAREIARTHSDLQETRAARRRVAQVAPVYGRGSQARRQIEAVG